MKNPESLHENETVFGHGREKVSTEAALDAQKKLVLHMTPDRIKSYIDENNEYDPFMDALMMRYMDKYDSGEYNGFAEYCNTHEEDEKFMDRVVSQKLEESDLQNIHSTIVNQEIQTPFFENEKEIDEFISNNIH